MRPRDPWMFNRAGIQPDPVAYTRMAADTMEAAEAATSTDDFFLRANAKLLFAVHGVLLGAAALRRRTRSRNA